MSFLDSLFAEYRWYRKRRGGHWEWWYIGSPVNDYMWLRLEPGTIPACGEAFALVEDW